MNKGQEFLNLYSNKGFIIDNEEIIVFKEYCLDYIQSCKKSNLIILGIDGYYLEDTIIRVNTLEIFDFSKTQEDIQNCYTLAEACIANMLNTGSSDGYMFTLSDKSTLS